MEEEGERHPEASHRLARLEQEGAEGELADEDEQWGRLAERVRHEVGDRDAARSEQIGDELQHEDGGAGVVRREEGRVELPKAGGEVEDAHLRSDQLRRGREELCALVSSGLGHEALAH